VFASSSTISRCAFLGNKPPVQKMLQAPTSRTTRPRCNSITNFVPDPG
jgi:hypothetical protein